MRKLLTIHSFPFQGFDSDDDIGLGVNDSEVQPANSKFELLESIRIKLTDQDLSRATASEKRSVISIIGEHLRCGDAELVSES